jgi:hypothetical protein
VSTSDPGILDTSTVALLERIGDPRTLPPELLITAVTLAELSVGPLVAADPGERATRQLRCSRQRPTGPLPFDAPAARAVGRVAASLHRAGRKTGARSYDAMIAAAARANDLPLFTCNPADFEHIDGLDLRPVPHPDQIPGT